MFLIACQKATVKDRGLICYLYSYLHLEGEEAFCRGCCYFGFNAAHGWHRASCRATCRESVQPN